MSSNVKVRERSFIETVNFPAIKMSYPERDGPKEIRGNPTRHTVEGRQKTISEGHPRSRKTGKYEEGGPFYTAKSTLRYYPRYYSASIEDSGGRWWHFDHHPFITPVLEHPLSVQPMPTGQPDDRLNEYGTEAISIVDPTNSNAELGVALGEIMNDRVIPIPLIQSWKRRTAIAKAAGSEYLNAVFGWLPLLDEINNVVESVRYHNKIVENYQNASGTLVHREFEFPVEKSSEKLEVPNARAVYSTQLSIGPGVDLNNATLTRERNTTIERWFSGTFTYDAHDRDLLDHSLRIGKEADKLYGLELTPERIWELAPWSWAIDWFSTAGAVLHNASTWAKYGQVLKYGYIMENKYITDTYTLSSSGIKGMIGSVPSAFVNTVNRRRQDANPFGFGVHWDDLDPFQLAVTAALGITRLR